MKIYISPELGSYYWLENGELFYAPMFNEKAPAILDTEKDGGAVEFEKIDNEKLHSGEMLYDVLLEIKNKLKYAS